MLRLDAPPSASAEGGVFGSSEIPTTHILPTIFPRFFHGLLEMKHLVIFLRTMAKDLQSKRSELPPSTMIIAELAYIVSDLQRLAKEIEEYGIRHDDTRKTEGDIQGG